MVDNLIDLQNLVARLIVDVHAGKLNPKTAAVLAPLIDLQLRLKETTENANLKQQVAESQKQLADKGDNEGPIRVLWIGRARTGEEATKPYRSANSLDPIKHGFPELKLLGPEKP
jgi:hypothetical protein